MKDKYNTLLAAIHALDPFDDDFCTDEDGDCTSCDMSHPKHVYDCPVTRLRNILSEAEDRFTTTKDSLNAIGFQDRESLYVTYSPHRDEVDRAIQIIERHRLSKLNAKAVIDCSGALESAIVDEVLYIKNASAKDVVIPLDKPFITSPTDNGV